MTGSRQRRKEATFRAGREEGLASAEAERNLFKGKYRSIVTLLNTTRCQLQEIFDHIDDEGDRRYFGSTNHVDWLRDLLNDMDGWSIDALLPKGDINKMEADPYAEIRAQRARAETAEAEMNKLREAALSAAEPVGEPLELPYKNWRGEISNRKLQPIRVEFGATEWHPEPQWLLVARDIEKNAERSFALKDFNPPQPAPSATVKAEQPDGTVGEMTPDRAIYFLKRFKGEEKMLGPHEQWALDFSIAILSAQVQDVADMPQSPWPASDWAIGRIKELEAQAVPEGWQLVPKEPTQEMCEAAPSLPAIHAIDDLPFKKSGWSMSAIVNRKRYLAMLAAAPANQERGADGC